MVDWDKLLAIAVVLVLLGVIGNIGQRLFYGLPPRAIISYFFIPVLAIGIFVPYYLAKAAKKRGSKRSFFQFYGWVLAPLLFVTLILVQMETVRYNERPQTRERCMLPAGFTCYDYSFDENGSLSLAISQTTGADINITGIGCNSDNAKPEPVDINPIAMHSGYENYAWIAGNQAGNKITCCGPTDYACEAGLSIRYVRPGSSGSRTVYGYISGNYDVYK